MFEKILTFVTPGPLTKSFRFNARVFYSWISLGLILDIGLVIFFLTSTAHYYMDFGTLVPMLIGLPITIALSGLFGLGLDSLRGSNEEHPGWYWWLFPILTYLVIGFWMGFAIVGICLAMVGVRLPEFKKPQVSHIDTQKFRKKIQQAKVGDVLEEFKEQIQQLQQLEQENKLEPQQQEVVRKLLRFNPSEYNQMFQDLFQEDELEELILLLLMMLGAEVN